MACFTSVYFCQKGFFQTVMFFDILKYIINLNETSGKKRILTKKDKDFFQTISFQNKKLIVR